MPTPAPYDEALQAICDEVEAEWRHGPQGANNLLFAKEVARRYAATVGAGVPKEVRTAFEAAKLQELFVDGDKADVYTHPPGSSLGNENEMVARCACGPLWQSRAVAVAEGLNWIGRQIAAEHKEPRAG